MSNCFEQYLEELSTLNFSPRTCEAYRHSVNRFIRYADDRGLVKLQDITLKDLEKYKLSLMDSNLSENTVDSYMRTLRNFFKYLEDKHHIFISPAGDLITNRPRPRLQPVPSEEDVRKLLCLIDVSKPSGIRDRALFETVYSTAARREEIIGMDLSDIDFRNHTARVFGKGRKERTVPLGKAALYWLGKYIDEVRPEFIKNNADEPALWIGKNTHGRINMLIVGTLIKDYARQAGIKMNVTLHSLRRACATHMLNNGAHPVFIQLLLGHATMKTMCHYLKVTITELRKMHSKTRVGQ